MKVLTHFQQGSLEWEQARCGRITMSRAKALLTGGKGKTRQSYIYDVLSEVLSGQPAEGFQSDDMLRGIFLEEYALRAFCEAVSLDVQPVGLVLQDDERIACSPDALVGDYAGVEIKCPKPRQHIRNMFADGMEDYRQQANGNMWVCDVEHWFIVSFCPWVEQKPLYIKLINRDRNMIAKLSRSAIEAADKVDELAALVKMVGSPLGVRAAAQLAREAWENNTGELIGATEK